MKAYLSFTLPEDEMEHYYALNGSKYYICLQDIDEWLRSLSKYENKKLVKIDEVRGFIRDCLSSRDLSLS